MLKSVMRFVFAGLLVAVPATVNAVPTGSIGVELGGTLTYSQGWVDLMKAAYPSTYYSDPQTGKGWGGLDVGLRLRAGENLTITPKLTFLFNAVSVAGEEDYINTIFVPAVHGRYMLGPAPSPYVGAELGLSIPKSGSDYWEFDSGGLAYGVSVGYALESDWTAEVGYTYVPGKAGRRTWNLGGVQLRFGKGF